MADNQHPAYLAYLAAWQAERAARAEFLSVRGDDDDAELDRWLDATAAARRALDAWRSVTEEPNGGNHNHVRP